MGILMQGERSAPDAGGHSRLYAWTVFALTFGLMLSDYVSRQVITPIFPFLKQDWSLTDTQLGALVSVVALIVGVGSIPIALLADRWGRVKSITAMAGLWGLATIGCGLSQNYGQLTREIPPDNQPHHLPTQNNSLHQYQYREQRSHFLKYHWVLF